MKYIISVMNKKVIEPFEVLLDNTTEVGDEINYNNSIYKITKIIINPIDGIIYFECSDISNKGKSKELTTIWS
jgi:hypothetical protein